MPHQSKRELEILCSVNNFILENFAGPISIGEISRRVELSEIKLYRGFKRNYNITIIGLQTKCRMEKAAALLITDKLIKEVAIEVGYKNSNQFCPQFKKHHGMTPSAYRMRYTNYPDERLAAEV